ncbi:hypothetical protein RhiirA5_394669 [Rhizophagus irregularis]|uniref:Uncharacterized protein n=1 Tax=Rhizophagus irregularis TaxID=588596 RepID=A0A2I1ET97_9GLOM|nr:hypothetical protein RhiirA5_394669 [Rhizophagus irregularis]PKY25356.1 hypothetical protein RhiirB3_527844 [Rhizophagus irregularis]CAB4480093.1 unnamed protein product [Rhizophagus irregularis]CAB5103387.1 unnamed protein product [Rhizophagus irregularis]CAB5387502.1 unnamed protein product [Rhizophagus irregularis]
MGHDLSKYIDPALFNTDSADSKISQRISTIAPNYNSGDLDASSDTLTLIPKLLEQSEEKLRSNDYEACISLLQRASNLGSGLAAAKLGFIYLHGLQDSSTEPPSFKYIIKPDYEMSAEYYFLSLKIINLIVYTLWDMSLLLDVIVSVTDLYRYKFDRKDELWNNGLEILKLFNTTLNENQFVKFQTHENNQIRNAIRVHILFIFALTHELDRKFSDAMKIYHECEKIGQTTISFSADKLVKKSHTNYRILQKELDKQTPNVLPICTECNFKPKNTAEVWGLLVCSKCQQAACCSRQCLQLHLTNDH